MFREVHIARSENAEIPALKLQITFFENSFLLKKYCIFEEISSSTWSQYILFPSSSKNLLRKILSELEAFLKFPTKSIKIQASDKDFNDLQRSFVHIGSFLVIRKSFSDSCVFFSSRFMTSDTIFFMILCLQITSFIDFEYFYFSS